MKELLEAAKAASQNAYCPYSKFRVGAAIRTGSGEIFSGCNVENASFGLTLCAERVAVFKAVSAGHTRLAATVIYTPTRAPVSPCGACRQVLAEFGPGMQILCCCDGAGEIQTTLKELLPQSFVLCRE